MMRLPTAACPTWGEGMAYFKATIGPPPAQKPVEKKDRPAAQKLTSPYFAAQVGRSPDPAGPAKKGEVFAPPSTCPLCRGDLAAEKGLYRCQGRCGSRWLAEETGRLIDLAALPFGVCACCDRPQALACGDRGAVCPSSGREYLLLSGGPALLPDAAPDGLCQCCRPAMPLIWQDQQLVCQVRTYQQYERRGDQLMLVAPDARKTSTAETLTAIDEALRRNSARLTVNGLFDLD